MLMGFCFSGVAMGSSIGHAIGGFFGGDNNHPATERQAANSSVTSQQDNVDRGNQWGASNCDDAAKQFTTCMDDNGGNMQICQWYLDQLVSTFDFCIQTEGTSISNCNQYRKHVKPWPRLIRSNNCQYYLNLVAHICIGNWRISI
jgi:hypothetical protein